jgi:hypothetical protein
MKEEIVGRRINGKDDTPSLATQHWEGRFGFDLFSSEDTP